MTNVIDCEFAELNNICMQEASICPGADVAPPSHSTNPVAPVQDVAPACDSTNPNTRTKRSPEPGSEGTNITILNRSTTANTSLHADPDNPLEMVFNPVKKGVQHSLTNEARKEYVKNFGNMDMERSYKALFEMLWYTQVPCFDIVNVTSVHQHENGLIKSCFWKGHKMPCSKLFRASPTDRGMCCSFNIQAAEEMFKSGDYKDMINKMQQRDKSMAYDLLETGLARRPKDNFEHFVPEAGVSKGLTLMLDSHSDLLSASSISDDFEGFLAVINDNKQFPITSQKSVLIRPGQHNLVSIDAKRVSARKDIRKYLPDKRNCFFYDENSLTAYSNYSHLNCVIECKVRNAFTALQEKDNQTCVPWFLPGFEGSYPMCNPWEGRKFVKEMEKIGDAECKKCRPDCEGSEISARISASSFRRCDLKNIDMSPLCTIGTKSNTHPPKWGQQVIDEYKAKGKIPDYIKSSVSTNRRRHIKDTDKRKIGINNGREIFAVTNKKEMEYDAYEKDIATVTFYFESSNSFEFLRQSRITMIEYIAQVGGLLGLCLGFSFISAIEIVYWLTFKLSRKF